MLKTAIDQKYYCPTYGYREGLALMKKHGYDCLDFEEFCETDTELFQLDSIGFEKYLRKQAEICREEGLEIHQTHGPWRWPPCDFTPMDREERLEKMSKSVEGTAILGCDKMIIHPIMPYTTWVDGHCIVKDDGYEQETYDINLEFMRRLCDVGRKCGVTICFENMPMPLFSLASIPDILRVVHDINDEYFKVCLDTGHSAVVKRDVAEDVRLIGKDLLQSLHIHDNCGHHDDHMSPFEGVIKWIDFCDALRQMDFDGVMSMEIKRAKYLPEELWEMEDVLLYRKIAALAKMASNDR